MVVCVSYVCMWIGAPLTCDVVRPPPCCVTGPPGHPRAVREAGMFPSLGVYVIFFFSALRSDLSRTLPNWWEGKNKTRTNVGV